MSADTELPLSPTKPISTASRSRSLSLRFPALPERPFRIKALKLFFKVGGIGQLYCPKGCALLQSNHKHLSFQQFVDCTPTYTADGSLVSCWNLGS